MKEQLKKKLNVPENWDKFDYEIKRYSFNDILAIVEEMEDVKNSLVDFYMWMVENDYEHNIRSRVEKKAEMFLNQ